MITDKIIKPSQCAIGFGIPTNKADFYHDKTRQDKDFAKRFKTWPMYKDQIVDHFNQAEVTIKQLGVFVIEQFTLDAFRDFFLQDRFDVIILFSHWKKQTIEFHDGLKHFSDIIDAVPLDFSGIIDLCVCHPKDLRIGLDNKRPKCIVKFTTEDALPWFWIIFYQALFMYLQLNDSTYIEAVETVFKKFQHASRKM